MQRKTIQNKRSRSLNWNRRSLWVEAPKQLTMRNSVKVEAIQEPPACIKKKGWGISRKVDIEGALPCSY